MIVSHYFEVDDCLENNTEANERKKLSSGNLKPVGGNQSASDTETKIGKQLFVSIRHQQRETRSKKYPISIPFVETNSPLRRCLVFREKTPTQRATVANKKLCSSCFNWPKSFPNWLKFKKELLMHPQNLALQLRKKFTWKSPLKWH